MDQEHHKLSVDIRLSTPQVLTAAVKAPFDLCTPVRRLVATWFHRRHLVYPSTATALRKLTTGPGHALATARPLADLVPEDAKLGLKTPSLVELGG